MPLKKPPQWVARHRAGLILGVACFVLMVFAGYHWVAQQMYWHQLSEQFKAEEANEHDQADIELRDADVYVNSFTYSQKITVGPSGFRPQELVVKPETKLIFTGTDETVRHVAVAPGSASPKYFEANVALTNHSILQTKLVAPGTYTFTDASDPAATLVVTVSP